MFEKSSEKVEIDLVRYIIDNKLQNKHLSFASKLNNSIRETKTKPTTYRFSTSSAPTVKNGTNNSEF